MELPVTVALASLVGSLHCAAMCGSLVGLCVASGEGSRRQRQAPHLAYHAARLVAYASLGAVAGAFGRVADSWLAEGNFGFGVALVCGGAVVVWGAWRLLADWGGARSSAVVSVEVLSRPRSSRRFAALLVSRLARRIQCVNLAVHGWASRRHPLLRGAVIGLASALLPCGWLYAFVVLAAGAGSALHGASLLAAFWLGTVPALALLAAVMRPLLTRLGRYAPALVTLAVVAAGLATIFSRQLAAEQLATRRLTTEQLTTTEIDALSPPCHAGIELPASGAERSP